MTPRFRIALALALGSLVLSGCGDLFEAGPVNYAENTRLVTELPDRYAIVPENAPEGTARAGVNNKIYQGEKALEGADRDLKASYPKGHKIVNLAVPQRNAVLKALADLFGPNPQSIKIPKGTGLPYGGRLLAAHVQEGRGPQQRTYRFGLPVVDSATKKLVIDKQTGKPASLAIEGGYTVYRHHCLHCHGVTGDGAGPTADFLFPRPRDYRKGIFKFTSTVYGSKPTRDDLRKTLRLGLPGTSMPSFESMMKPEEIEQVIDYVIFLSMRGEVENGLIDAVAVADATDPNPLPADMVESVAESVFTKWTSAQNDIVNTPTRRTSSESESITRGRELFLGRTAQRLECWGCHGPQARGDGPSFIDQRIFNLVVFERMELDDAIRKVYEREQFKAEAAHEHAGREHAASESKPPLEPLAQFLKKNQDLWKQKVDDWGQPLRPANLNLGVYKGGRRPLDIYWRISKGINGAQMPGHGSALNPEQIWDLVNFVLALPYEPELLRGAAPGPLPQPTAVAQSAAREGN